MSTAIKVEHISKTFKLPHEKQSSIKGLFISLFRGRRTFEKQKVLQDVSFEIKDGEFFGIVGRNGSGKSTLLKLIAGIYSPNAGQIHINGKLTPFIELGVGFNPELTGRENVFLNGALLGFDRTQMDEMYQTIVEFAELEKFMDQKLKNYSSGMQVRLAFSIAIRANTDILLIDEVLAVGDAIFQQKCFNYFKELKKQKKTVIFVSHDTGALEEYCDRAVLIEKGKVVRIGETRQITRDYIDLLNKEEDSSNAAEHQKKQESTKNRWGTGDVKITSATIKSKNGPGNNNLFTDKDEELVITVRCKAMKQTESPVYGVIVNDSAGESVFSSNTIWQRVDTKDLKEGETMTLEWTIPNAFNAGNFTISPAAANRIGSVMYDWRDELIEFKINKELKSRSFINVPHTLIVK